MFSLEDGLIKCKMGTIYRPQWKRRDGNIVEDDEPGGRVFSPLHADQPSTREAKKKKTTTNANVLV